MTKKHHSRKYSFNQHFFDNPKKWTEKQAYWLGWLASDGYINREYINLNLQETDRCVLDSLKNLIKYTGPLSYLKPKPAIWGDKIYQSQNQFQLRIYGVDLSKKLNSLGLDNKKGSNYKFPTFLKKELYPHFLRGLIEGDGSFSFSNNCLQFELISTPQVLSVIQKIFSKIGIKTFLKEKVFGSGTRIIAFKGNNMAMKLFNYIYKNCKYYLPRKVSYFIKLFLFKRGRTQFKKAQQDFELFRKNILSYIKKHPEFINS